MNSIGQLKFDERFLSSIALLSILLGGLWVRVSGVNGYYYNADEMEFLIIAKGETLEEVWRRSLAELHPPLAHFIRHYLLMITPDVFHQRLFSVTAGMVSVIGMYRLGFQLRGRFLGLFCALCIAFFPVAVSTSITIRNYAFFMAFLSWALYYFMRYQMQEKRTDLLYYTLLLFLASATHFTGFLVGAAIGISEGMRLASAKRWNNFALFGISFLPLLLLGVFFYSQYLAPGTAGPMWNRLVIETGGAPNDFSGRFLATCLGIIGYFVPLLRIVEPKSDTDLFILLFSSVLFFSMYIKGLLRMYKEKPAACTLILVMWVIAIFAALANFYPFQSNRHNYYFLLFFVLPLGYELDYFVRNIHYQRFAQYLGFVLIILIITFFKKTDSYLKHGEEFPLKQKDFNVGQQFLDQHLQSNDIIVTERFSYHYFLYAKDAGKAPYDSYVDAPYHHKTTILAPSDPPFNARHTWETFRDSLKSRLASNITMPESKVWFVMYGWKNTEIWHLMNCAAIRPQINDYFTRDGVLIFSIQVKVLSNFIKENTAWEFCYSGYKPLITAETFKAYPQITQINEVTD
ncbi:MAG: glycosyltransferase family 39 protein [Methylobacter sp.]